ncbi:MAG TPA: hypothetical protein PLI09_27320 [Candidatus Hydrogenedentes bacterium]|nr:hypothetical protein [Candidatus Hydrogenedentota bacterium]
MFLALLNKPQKKAFWTLANAFVAADGKLDASEKTMLDMMKKEMGLDSEPRLDRRSADSLFAIFDTRQSRIVTLLEIIGLGYSDSKYSASECEFVARMSKAFKITQKEVSVLENWVSRQLALVTEAHALISGKGK